MRRDFNRAPETRLTSRLRELGPRPTAISVADEFFIARELVPYSGRKRLFVAATAHTTYESNQPYERARKQFISRMRGIRW